MIQTPDGAIPEDEIPLPPLPAAVDKDPAALMDTRYAPCRPALTAYLQIYASPASIAETSSGSKKSKRWRLLSGLIVRIRLVFLCERSR